MFGFKGAAGGDGGLVVESRVVVFGEVVGLAVDGGSGKVAVPVTPSTMLTSTVTEGVVGTSTATGPGLAGGALVLASPKG
jgi:hypothetical protein